MEVCTVCRVLVTIGMRSTDKLEVEAVTETRVSYGLGFPDVRRVMLRCIDWCKSASRSNVRRFMLSYSPTSTCWMNDPFFSGPSQSLNVVFSKSEVHVTLTLWSRV